MIEVEKKDRCTIYNSQKTLTPEEQKNGAIKLVKELDDALDFMDLYLWGDVDEPNHMYTDGVEDTIKAIKKTPVEDVCFYSFNLISGDEVSVLVDPRNRITVFSKNPKGIEKILNKVFG